MLPRLGVQNLQFADASNQPGMLAPLGQAIQGAAHVGTSYIDKKQREEGARLSLDGQLQLLSQLEGGMGEGDYLARLGNVAPERVPQELQRLQNLSAEALKREEMENKLQAEMMGKPEEARRQLRIDRDNYSKLADGSAPPQYKKFAREAITYLTRESAQDAPSLQNSAKLLSDLYTHVVVNGQDPSTFKPASNSTVIPPDANEWDPGAPVAPVAPVATDAPVVTTEAPSLTDRIAGARNVGPDLLADIDTSMKRWKNRGEKVEGKAFSEHVEEQKRAVRAANNIGDKEKTTLLEQIDASANLVPAAPPSTATVMEGATKERIPAIYNDYAKILPEFHKDLNNMIRAYNRGDFKSINLRSLQEVLGGLRGQGAEVALTSESEALMSMLPYIGNALATASTVRSMEDPKMARVAILDAIKDYDEMVALYDDPYEAARVLDPTFELDEKGQAAFRQAAAKVPSYGTFRRERQKKLDDLANPAQNTPSRKGVMKLGPSNVKKFSMGAVVDGYRLIGEDATDPKNWEKVR